MGRWSKEVLSGMSEPSAQCGVLCNLCTCRTGEVKRYMVDARREHRHWGSFPRMEAMAAVRSPSARLGAIGVCSIWRQLKAVNFIDILTDPHIATSTKVLSHFNIMI